MRRKLDRRFNPPAPIVPVRLRAPGGVESLELPGKIDTGADLCCIPEHAIGELDLPPTRTVRASGFAGALREVVVYRVDVEIDGAVHRRIEAVATTRPYAVVGRNVLRSLVLRVDGPRELLELRRPR